MTKIRKDKVSEYLRVWVAVLAEKNPQELSRLTIQLRGLEWSLTPKEREHIQDRLDEKAYKV